MRTRRASLLALIARPHRLQSSHANRAKKSGARDDSKGNGETMPPILSPRSLLWLFVFPLRNIGSSCRSWGRSSEGIRSRLRSAADEPWGPAEPPPPLRRTDAASRRWFSRLPLTSRGPFMASRGIPWTLPFPEPGGAELPRPEALLVLGAEFGEVGRDVRRRWRAHGHSTGASLGAGSAGSTACLALAVELTGLRSAAPARRHLGGGRCLA